MYFHYIHSSWCLSTWNNVAVFTLVPANCTLSESPIFPIPHPLFQYSWPNISLFYFFFNFYLLFIYYVYFLAVLGLRFCARASSSCGKQGPLFIAVRGPLTIVASLVAEQRLQTLRLSSCGSRAQLLRGMWDPPRPGLEPVSPALAGRFSTTAPPGKPSLFYF